MPRSFVWIGNQLRTRQFLVDFEPEEFALSFFLPLAADEQGLSCWRLDVMEKSMPAFPFPQLRKARENLVQKHLLAFRPWNINDPDGIYQLLPVPLKLQPKGKWKKDHRYEMIAVAHKPARVIWRLVKDHRKFPKRPPKRHV